VVAGPPQYRGNLVTVGHIADAIEFYRKNLCEPEAAPVRERV